MRTALRILCFQALRDVPLQSGLYFVIMIDQSSIDLNTLAGTRVINNITPWSRIHRWMLLSMEIDSTVILALSRSR